MDMLRMRGTICPLKGPEAGLTVDLSARHSLAQPFVAYAIKGRTEPFMALMRDRKTKEATHKPGRDGFHSVPDLARAALRRKDQGRSGIRPYQVHG